MAVSTFVQPDFTGQTATVYKTSIDDAVAVHHQIAGPFAPHEQSTPDLTVRLDAANFSDLVTRATVTHAAQNTATLSAPSVNPRKDIVYVDRISGDVGVIAGAEAASPVDPTIPVGKLPVGRINWTTSMTEITNTDLDDIRAIGSLGLSTAAFINVGTTDGLIPSLGSGGGLTLTSTAVSEFAGPALELFRDSSSSAVDDVKGIIDFSGRNSAAEKLTYTKILSKIIDPADGSEDGALLFQTRVTGSLLERMILEQGLRLGSPIDGDKGPGTGNFENGLFINGVEVITGAVAVIDRDMSANEIVDTTTETTLYSFSVPANMFGTDKALRVSIRGSFLNNSGSNRTVTMRVKYGSTTLFDDATSGIQTNVDRRAFILDFILAAVNSTSAQQLNGRFRISNVGGVTAGYGNTDSPGAFGGEFAGASSEDSTGALTLDVTMEHGVAAATISIIAEQRIIELLP